MRGRSTLGGLMLLIFLIGLALGLFTLLIQERRHRVSREYVIALRAAQAAQVARDSESKALRAAAAGVLPPPSIVPRDEDEDALERLRRENDALRARVRELEAKLGQTPATSR